MKTKVLRYNTVVRKEGKDFVAYVPTLGISDFGKTLDQAQKNVKKAIECHIEGLAKTGFDIPTPDSTDFYIGQANVSVPENFKFAYWEMPKLAQLKPREVDKILLENGFVINVSKSSHRQYFNAKIGAHTTVPFHSKNIAPGTLRSIVRQSQLPIDLFRK